MAIFDDNDMDFPEAEEEEFEGESSNRTFIIAASVLGGIILLSLVCVAAYALVLAPRQKQQVADAEATRVAQNTQVAEMLTETAVAEAEALAAMASPTVVASPSPSPTPVIAVATDTPTSTPDIAATGTVAAALTQAALALQETPIATLPAELTNTGFADDVGISGLFGMVILLLAVIFFARRMRQANA
jgi:type II secretory pathway pseudopilin PulG